MTGNYLTDILEETHCIESIQALDSWFAASNKITLLDLVNAHEYGDRLIVIDSYGVKKTIRSIYEELDYPINRGPIFYVSNYVLNYSFETYIIFTQDGMLCQDPNNNRTATFYAWDNWKAILYTKHKDIEAPVILLAYPENEDSIEISISPKLDMRKNILLQDQLTAIEAFYTEIVKMEMHFARTLFDNLWEIVDANRNSSLNNIPLDKLFIYNHPSLIQDLI